MEDLSFFNEREAECFDREDTLSQSDLEKLYVDENMPEMERVEHLLKTGLDKQKISILTSLPKVLASNNSKSDLTIILNCLKGVWRKYESEMNADPGVLVELFKGLASLACGTVDGKVLSYPTVTFHDEYAQELENYRAKTKDVAFLLSNEQIVKLLVPFALDIITDIQHKDYAEEASSTVLALLPRIGPALKKTQILRVAMDKGDVSQAPGSRLICCFILGAITALNLLSAPDIEGLYFHKMMALCQDTDADVRKCMCIQLDGLARAIGEEHASKELLPELLELLNDEEEQVKQTAFLTLLSLVDCFKARDRVKQIIPEFICIAVSLPDYLVNSLAEQYGELVTKLGSLNHLGNNTGPVLMQSYSKLCSHEEDKVRQYCAYNFPAIVKAFGSTYVSLLMDDILAKLASDPNVEVRHHIAAGIHEVASMLGQQRTMLYIKNIVLNLMMDESPVVQGMALSRVPQLLSVMINPNDEDQKTTILDLVIKAVVQHHGTLPLSQNRDRLVYLTTLQSLPSWLSSLQMYEIVVPIIFNLIEDGNRPVQLLAMQVVLKCIRYNNTASHRYTLLSRLRTEYGRSRSYWRRILYLDACVYALTLNSRQYCQRNFFETAIDLLDDPVPNVRLKATLLVPLWKDSLSYLSDDKCLDRIQQFLYESITDSDRDVANALSETRQTIAENGAEKASQPQDDAEDKRKLSEEVTLGLTSDHEDLSFDSTWSSMLEYTLVVGKDGQVVRRARVKSFDLVSKIARVPGKDTGRMVTMSTSSSGIGSIGNSMAVTTNIGLKGDTNKVRGPAATNTYNKVALPFTTLPNCATTRPGHAKMPLTAKVTNLTGKGIIMGNKSNSRPTRSGTGLSKDSGAITRIPNIRPSVSAKREPSPLGSAKPNSVALTPPSRLGALDSGGMSAFKLQKAASVPGTPKR